MQVSGESYLIDDVNLSIGVGKGMIRKDKKMYGVISRNRTVWYDRSITLRDVQEDLRSRNLMMNITQTLMSYGLQFNDERSFTAKYKSEFNLKNGKTMWDITLRELDLYKELLIGVNVKR